MSIVNVEEGCLILMEAHPPPTGGDAGGGGTTTPTLIIVVSKRHTYRPGGAISFVKVLLIG